MKKIILITIYFLFQVIICSCQEEVSRLKQLEVLNFDFKTSYHLNEDVSLESILFRVTNDKEKSIIYKIHEQQVHIKGHFIDLETFKLDTSRSGQYELIFSIEDVYITFQYEVLSLMIFVVDELIEIVDLLENNNAPMMIYLNQPNYYLELPFEINQGLTLKPAEHLENVTFDCLKGCFYLNELNENEVITFENLILNNHSSSIPAIEIDGIKNLKFNKLALINMEVRSAYGILTKEKGTIYYNLEVNGVIFDGLNKKGIAIEFKTLSDTKLVSVKLIDNVFKNFNRSSKNILIQSEYLKDVIILYNTFIGKNQNIPLVAIDLICSNTFEGELQIKYNEFYHDYVYNISLYSFQHIEVIKINQNNFLTSNHQVVHFWNRSLENNNLLAHENYFTISPYIMGYEVIYEPRSETPFLSIGSKRLLDE
jgi:hypothetical protein